MRINGEHHPGMDTPSNQPDLMHTPIEKERNLPAIAGHCRVQTNQSCCTHRPRASLRFCRMSLGLAGLTGRGWQSRLQWPCQMQRRIPSGYLLHSHGIDGPLE